MHYMSGTCTADIVKYNVLNVLFHSVLLPQRVWRCLCFWFYSSKLLLCLLLLCVLYVIHVFELTWNHTVLHVHVPTGMCNSKTVMDLTGLFASQFEQICFTLNLKCVSELLCVFNDPCLNNGTCMEAPGDTVTCDCLPGYTGVNCETGL